MHLREIDLGVWIGFDWLRIGTGGGLLWVRWWTFGFLRHGISLVHCVCYLISFTRNAVLSVTSVCTNSDRSFRQAKERNRAEIEVTTYRRDCATGFSFGSSPAEV
jgi:hypothetical protein